MLSKKQLRDVHIAIAVGAAVVFIGGFLFRNAGEGALELVGLAMLVATFGTLIFLIGREERQLKREERDQ